MYVLLANTRLVHLQAGDRDGEGGGSLAGFQVEGSHQPQRKAEARAEERSNTMFYNVHLIPY